MRYYIEDKIQPQGFLEVSKAEYISLFGDETTHHYVSAVYQGELTIDDVPTDLQASVQVAVDNRINRWGLYENQETDRGVQIRKVGTEEVYDEAIDVENAPYTYEETSEPIEEVTDEVT